MTEEKRVSGEIEERDRLTAEARDAARRVAPEETGNALLDGMTTDSIVDKFKLLKESNAACVKLVFKDKDDSPLSAAIFVVGPEAKEILDAVQKVEDSWD